MGGALGGKSKPSDYAPFYAPPPRSQTPAEARAIVRAHLDAVRRRKERV